MSSRHAPAGTGEYACARPHYPTALFAWLSAQCEHRSLAWDAGCGNGQAVLVLREKGGERRLPVPVGPTEAAALDRRLHGDKRRVSEPPRRDDLWTYVRDDRAAGSDQAPAVWFAYSRYRRGEHPARHLKDFTGILQADGYAGFDRLYASGEIFEAACWAHVRRKFFDLHALQASPTGLGHTCIA